MKILLDSREQDLFSMLNIVLNHNDSDITLDTAQLTIGDIIILDNNDTELLIIERKSVKDLAASIVDGRYNEQSFRLNNSNIHNHNIIYLIEEDIESYKPPPIKNPVTKEALYSSIFSIMYFKGFSVFKTKNLKETAEFITRIYN